MNKKKSIIISLILFALGIIFGLMAYFMFHYLTPKGVLGPTFQTEMQKPLVTCVAAGLSCLYIVGGTIFFLIGLIGYSNNKRLN